MIIDFIKAEKTKRGLSNQDLSNLSGVPVGTVNRILAGGTENPSFQTVCDLLKAMGCSVDAALGLDVAAEKKSEKEKLYDEINLYERVIDSKDKIIEQKDKWILRLFLFASIFAGFILALLLVDLLVPTIGFLRY